MPARPSLPNTIPEALDRRMISEAIAAVKLLNLALGLPFLMRLGLTVVILAPIGFLMGLPLPGGLRMLSGDDQGATLVPWLWAVNGSASVMSAVLAALLALTFGFNVVLGGGVACYAGAWLIAQKARY